MSRKKDYYLVLDTETANSVEEPLPYDIGWVICDRKGNIYRRRSFVVSEVFADMADVMLSAYYADKIPMYWDDLKSGKRKLRGMYYIRKVMLGDMKEFNVKEVGAYNMAFDKKALNNLIRYVSKSAHRWFFPFGTKYFCIWNMASNAILNRASYIKFAEKNGFISESGNIMTRAEAAYRYIMNDVNFIESHTGLEDVEIEVAIMAKCYQQHKKLKRDINPSCWRIPQQKRREMGAA